MRTGDAGEMISYLNRRGVHDGRPAGGSLKLLRLSPGDLVLDAGCGSGVAAVELAALVGGEGRVHAIDPSDAMVSRTSERAGMLPIEASIGDVRSLDVPTGSCDAARTERVLIHLTRRSARWPSRSSPASSVRADGYTLVETCHVQCRIDGDDFLVPSTRPLGWPTPLRVCSSVPLSSEPGATTCNRCLGRSRSPRSLTRAGGTPRGAPRVAVRSGAPEAEVASALAEMHRRDEEGTFFAVMMFYVAAGTVDG